MKIKIIDLCEKAVMVLLWLFLFLLFFKQEIRPEDVFWHLSTGKWIVNHLQVPYFDPYPFANEKTLWIQHNEWLGSTLLYLVYKLGGFLGLKVFRALLFISSISVLFFYARKKIPASLLIILILLVAYGLLTRPLLKPETLNLIFIPVVLIILFVFQKGKPVSIFLLPLLGLFWFNLHVGALVYGALLITIFLSVECIQFLIYRTKNNSSADLSSVRIKQLGTVFFLFILAFLVNPYGIEGFLYPFKVFLIPSYIDFYKVSRFIAENQPPAYLFMSWNYFYFFVLAGMALAVSVFHKNRVLFIALFTVSLAAFLCFQRNSIFFVLVAAYIIVEGGADLAPKDIEERRWFSFVNIFLMASLVVFLMIQIVSLFSETVYLNNKKSRTLFFVLNPCVISTVNLLKDNGVAGPVFNDVPMGNSLLWFDYPQLRPFVDGRHTDKARFNSEMSVIVQPAIYWPQVEKYYGFKIFTGFQSSFPGLLAYINSQPDWQLIAVQGPIVVYVKRGTFHLLAQLDKFEERLKSVVITDADIQQLRMFTEIKQTGALERFFNPSSLEVQQFSEGETLWQLGYKGAAIKSFIEASKVSHQPYMQAVVRAVLKQISVVKTGVSSP